jgi:hypothetical protein
MDKLTDEQLLEIAYNKGWFGISEDVYELFKTIINTEET